MFSSKRAASSARPGLHYDRRALRRRLADVRAGNGEIFSFVINLADQGRVGVYSGLAVELDCVGAPGAVPEFVDDGHVFFADGVALIVLGLIGTVG